MPDTRRLERIAGAINSYFNSLLVRQGVPPQQVVTYAFGDKHCFRNYPLQEMAV